MNAIRQKIFGQLFVSKAQTVLWLFDEEVAGVDMVYLRYGLTLRGTEKTIFPAFALDDWGNEYGRLPLYKWLRQEGDRFPRAEVFGFDDTGRETQHFLREIELHWSYPLFAYTTKNTPISDGTLIQTVVITNESVEMPVQLPKRPVQPTPLRNSRVQWWHASSDWMSQSFSFANFV